MSTIYEMKELAVTETPLLLFDCTLANGQIERWSTHAVTESGAHYEARVLNHNIFEMQAASEQGVDSIPRISIVLGNADSHFSEIERATGWKGAKLSVSFVFYDLRNDLPASERSPLFQGICNPPDEIREATFRITAVNRMNMQRGLLPQVRIQRRCPWSFPGTAEQRAEAVAGGADGRYSRFYRCGYSPDVPGGTGTLNGDEPYTSCGFTRSECAARGMAEHFGGIEFVPPTISVRTSGDKNWHTSAVAVNAARYNDFVPMAYGIAWYAPPVVFARNDGNLTRLEALLGIGEIEGVLKVLVNDVEIPMGVPGANMTGTGWYSIPTLGARTGVCNPDFTGGDGQPAGDPYGSMAYLSVVVPNRLNDGTSLPRIKALVQGLKIPTYTAAGEPAGERFSSNPAWILLDILRRTGWSLSEIDLGSFADAAEYCDVNIEALDNYGNPILIPRFQCNVALTNRKSAGELMRGIRLAARMNLTFGEGGLLRARVEDTIAGQQPIRLQWSNSADPLDGGWPSYEFGDGSSGFGGILRNGNDEPSFRVYTRSIADTPNRFSVEFQDALNEYQQDSLSIVDPEDAARSGQEISATLGAIGLPNYDQAARILKLSLDKSLRGNTYVEFDTSVRCLGVRAGDLITLTYLKEGFNRQLFRVLKVAPGVNHRITRITAQIHGDEWYVDTNGQPASGPGGRRQSDAGSGTPRPLIGTKADENGDLQFDITGTSPAEDGGETAICVRFLPPTTEAAAGPGIPLISLTPMIGAGGALRAGQILYYTVSGVNSEGHEGSASFLVRAAIESDGSQVTLSGLSFAPGAARFHVYRGNTPARLFRIATGASIAAAFTDAGLENQPIAPPDPNFDHANFYWRLERLPESAATIHSATTVGNSSIEMSEDYGGATARITRGRGAGQERAVVANSTNTVTVASPWTVEPDETSYFALSDSGWRFGAETRSDTVQFTIPNRPGEIAHITGRAANASNVEADPEASTVTRFTIGDAGTSDQGRPPAPSFGLRPGKRGGTMELSGISFAELKNTRTISSATLTVYYWDELEGAPLTSLASGTGGEGDIIVLNTAGAAQQGGFIQVDSEVVRVIGALPGGATYRVERGALGSGAATHNAGTIAYCLKARTEIAPFPSRFFGSQYSGSWSHPITLPNVRAAGGELLVTNRFGDSAAGAIHLTDTLERGLRTFAGGQYTIQVDGFLAVDACAAPALIVESSHTVREVYAALGAAADAPVSLQLNVDGNPYGAPLVFAPESQVSTSNPGYTLPPLIEGSKITVSTNSVGSARPGRNLTVIIRL